MERKRLKQLYADDPDALRLLEAQDQTELLKEMFKSKLKADAEEVNFKFLKGEKGEKGDPGKDGIDGRDGLDGIDGENGRDGKDGRNGIDGTDGKPGLPGKDGSPDTPQQIADKLNTTKETVDATVIKGLPTIEALVKELKRGKYLEPRDIRGMRLDMNDQRWHGGGSSFTSPLTTKGDLYTFTTVDARLPVGADGTVLSADSTQATGLKWIAVAGTGTVTSVTSADANATVANTTTTPVITIVSAPKLQTARTINGVSFDGTASITVTAAAGTLTGTTLNSTVVTSSLTSVGTIATGVWNGTAIGLTYGGTGADLSAIAKGGLISGTGAAAVGITTVGTDGQVLSADSASAGGIKWITVSGTGTVTTVSVVSANGFAWHSCERNNYSSYYANYDDTGVLRATEQLFLPQLMVLIPFSDNGHHRFTVFGSDLGNDNQPPHKAMGY
jgi:Collagen triple helix repeat (20 copies).